jgi:hypothetical protein
MRRLWLPLLLTVGYGILWAASPRALAAGQPSQSFELVAIRQANFVQVWESIQPSETIRGTLLVDLPSGAEDLVLRGPGEILRVGAGAAKILSQGDAITVLYRLPASNPFVWDETLHQETTQASFFFGPGIYPSGLAASPFSYQGETRLGGKVLRVFSADNLPADQSILWPMTLGHPNRPVEDAFQTSLVAVPLLAAAVGWRRLRLSLPVLLKSKRHP